MKRPEKSRGFSLFEILLTLGLVTLALISAMSSLRVTKNSGRALACSVELKSVLTQARAQAIAEAVPVGLVFPTRGGLNPVVQEYAVLKGTAVGTPISRRSIAKEYPNIGIFIGAWTTQSGATFTTEPPAVDSYPQRFAIDSWLPTDMVGHAAYVFLPSGALITNSQVALSKEYPLVLCESLNLTPGTPAQLTAVGEAQTLTISTDTTVRLQRGIPDGNVLSGGPDVQSWLPGTFTPPAGTTPGAPTILSVDLLPAPVDAVYATNHGIHGIVEAGHVLTFRVRASDPDGQQLTCNWTATGGQFAHRGAVPMFYDAATEEFHSTWQWRAPAGAADDETFDFQVEVRDPTNVATALAGVEVNPRVLVIPAGVLLFGCHQSTDSIVYSCSFDGLQRRPIGVKSEPDCLGELAISHNGQRIAFGWGILNPELAVGNAGGSLSIIPIGGVDSIKPIFSPDVSQLFVQRGLLNEIYDVSGAGGAASPIPGALAGFSPDGMQALITVDPTGPTPELATIAADGSGSPNTVVEGVALDWNFSGLYFKRNIQGDGVYDLCRVPPTGSESDVVVLKTGVPAASAIGGEGRYLFYINTTAAETGIYRVDLTNDQETMVVGTSGFVNRMNTEPPNFVRVATSR